MMEADEFLQEIVDNPDDDMPRLVFADWLEERADPRGEFIRLGCQMARYKNPDTRWRNPWHRVQLLKDMRHLPEYQALLNRQLTLLVKHRDRWLEPFGNNLTEITFERGFVEEGATTAVGFVQHAPQWYRLTPLRRLWLIGAGCRLASFLQCPHLMHLNSLALGSWDEPLGYEDAVLLAECRYLVNLRHIDLGNHEVTELGIQELLQSPYLHELRSLEPIPPIQSQSLQSALTARFGTRLY